MRGRGLVQGLVFEQPDRAGEGCKRAFDRGLLVETSGPDDEVVKLLPLLTISQPDLATGLGILSDAAAEVELD